MSTASISPHHEGLALADRSSEDAITARVCAAYRSHGEPLYHRLRLSGLTSVQAETLTTYTFLLLADAIAAGHDVQDIAAWAGTMAARLQRPRPDTGARRRRPPALTIVLVFALALVC